MIRLPITGIKLDARKMTENDDYATYLRNLIGLSRGMDKQITANYVEDAHTAEQLSNWGGDFLQGFWIGKPRPLEDVMGQPLSLSKT